MRLEIQDPEAKIEVHIDENIFENLKEDNAHFDSEVESITCVPGREAQQYEITIRYDFHNAILNIRRLNSIQLIISGTCENPCEEQTKLFKNVAFAAERKANQVLKSEYFKIMNQELPERSELYKMNSMITIENKIENVMNKK